MLRSGGNRDSNGFGNPSERVDGLTDSREVGQAAVRFERLYRKWFSTVRDSAFAILGCEAGADDAAQRVFARLWKRGVDGLSLR